MKIVVGLHNPEPAYRGTRHNAGAEAVEVLARRLGVRLKRGPRRVRCRLAATVIDGAPAVLALPKASMNVCGPAVRSAVQYHEIPLAGLLVVHDDIDMAFGRLRLRRGRGHGGHNGVRSVAAALGAPDFWRLKVGVGRPPGNMDPARYVLSRFFEEEREEAARMVQDAAEVARVFINDPDRAVSLAGGRRADSMKRRPPAGGRGRRRM